MPVYRVIGLMSGTSLDGLDIAYCEFRKKGPAWGFRILKAETKKYSLACRSRLAALPALGRDALRKEHTAFGGFLGREVRSFIKRHKLHPDFVASHGHTVFHRPEKGITFQAGEGQALADACGFPVVCDFRSLDVKLGGQGAPLVPVGDEYLFKQYAYCLNLGGFANISYRVGKARQAFDICPVNIALNRFALELGKGYDKGGAMARKGRVQPELLRELNTLSFYRKSGPKSLGAEWLEEEFMPLIDKYRLSVPDKLCTVTEHAAFQIGKCAKTSAGLQEPGRSQLLVTGGGAYNDFLLERIKAYTRCKVVLPRPEIIEFKEALIFAYMGVLRMRGEVNCLASVTGAKRDCSGGNIYRP